MKLSKFLSSDVELRRSNMKIYTRAGKGLSQCPIHTFFRTGGGGGMSDADVRSAKLSFFDLQNFHFFENYGVFARTRGLTLRQGEHNATRRKVVNFSWFSMDVFYKRSHRIYIGFKKTYVKAVSTLYQSCSQCSECFEKLSHWKYW